MNNQRITPQAFQSRLEHIWDQASKRQWMNVLTILSELNEETIKQLNDVLKNRPSTWMISTEKNDK